MEEKALSRKPTWKEMREEFKDIGASSNSNYCKFMKFKLTPVKTGECFDEEEVLIKRSIIEDILEKYNTHFISDFPFQRTLADNFSVRPFSLVFPIPYCIFALDKRCRVLFFTLKLIT